MALTQFLSLEPGEAVFAEELKGRYKDKIDLYFPLKDTGIDLLTILSIEGGSKLVSFQIKESGYYEKQNEAWHEVSQKSLEKNKDRVDFYVFVIYLPKHLTVLKNTPWEIHFVICPTKILIERAEKKKLKDGDYVFHFRFEGSSLKERRDESVDYTEYLNAWNLIDRVEEGCNLIIKT